MLICWQSATVGQPIDTQSDCVYNSEIITPNQADGVASDADSFVAYTVDFSEPVSGIGGGDINVEGGTLVPGTVHLSDDGLQATFEVQASDESETDLVVTVMDSVTDLHGNALVVSSSDPVTVDTVNPGAPEVMISRTQDQRR